MANTIIRWFMGIVAALFAILVAAAGWSLVTSAGNPAAMSEAKKRFVNVFIGLLIVLGAWIFVDTIMLSLTGTESGSWSEVECLPQTQTISKENPIEETFEDTTSVASINPDSSTIGGVDENGFLTCGPSDPRFPDCGVDIVANENMNPIFDPADGGSSLVREGAEARMQAMLSNQFACLQSRFGRSITINDGIAKAGTSRESETANSRHFYGDALDLSTGGMNNADKLRLFRDAKGCGFTGFGFGNTILHVDLGTRRAWDYGNSTYGGVSTSQLIAEARR